MMKLLELFVVFLGAHGALRAPRRRREADAREALGPLPGRGVERLAGRARLRVRPSYAFSAPYEDLKLKTK